MMTFNRRCYYALSIAQSVGFKVTFERQSRRVIVAVHFQPQASGSLGFSHPIQYLFIDTATSGRKGIIMISIHTLVLIYRLWLS